MTASALRAPSRLRDHREGLVVERHEARPTTTAAIFDPGPTPRTAPHRDLRTTLNNYSQLDVDDLGGALAKLPAVVPPAPPPAEVAKPEVVAATASGDAAKRVAVFYPASTGDRRWKTRSRIQRENRSESAFGVGSEHRVRTGDLRLGKANRPGHQRSLGLTNRLQPVEFIWEPERQPTCCLTYRPRRSTTVVFHGGSKMAQGHLTSRRLQCSSAGPRTRFALLASAASWRTRGTI